MPPLFQLNGLGSCDAIGAKRQLPHVERSASLASTNHPHGNGKKAVRARGVMTQSTTLPVAPSAGDTEPFGI